MIKLSLTWEELQSLLEDKLQCHNLKGTIEFANIRNLAEAKTFHFEFEKDLDASKRS